MQVKDNQKNNSFNFSNPRAVAVGFIVLIIAGWILEGLLHTFIFNNNTLIFNLFQLDSHEFWMRISIIILLSFFLIYTYKINIKLKKTELSKFIKEEEFTLLTNSTSDVIWTTDLDGNFKYVNSSVMKLRGYTPQEILHQNLFDTFTINSIKNVDRILLSANFNNNSKEYIPIGIFELEQFCKDNTCVWTETSINMIHSNDGKPIGIMGISRNITERKKDEEKIQKLLEEIMVSRDLLEEETRKVNDLNEILTEKNDKLKELNSTKDKFFSIIAHDLRNPIGSFRSMTKALADNFTEFTEEERLTFLSSMKTASELIYDLLENLLVWAQSQKGTLNFFPIILDLNEIINNKLLLFRQSSQIKFIQIESNIGNGKIVKADSNMLNTILRNIINNAIKFTPEGGKISISAYPDSGDFITVSIKDTGVGIADKYIDKIFRIDSNVSTEGTNREKGTGLGLIICKEFIEKHGGRIWLESLQNIGTTVFFTLPRAKFD
ncbi:MAG: response regulator receiver sensor signal transduction histidine kinase [Ignavibacteria bacterium]|nr:response regulator receiver sensor signal transduction histidine kinase [Ignavibacteria bacterium]